MTIQPEAQPGASASTTQAQIILATAASYQAEQEKAKAQMLATILTVWLAIDTKNAYKSWVASIGQRIYVLISILQELIASDSNGYVRKVLGDQDILYDGPSINPINFAGIASDGRDLESLIAGALVEFLKAKRQGLQDQQALDRGANFLRLVVNTQIADAARAAESVSLVVADGRDMDTGKKVDVGWVRLLTPPSCGRCAVLAGKFYKWSDGFERHPNCDCRHIPVTVAAADGIVANSYTYFNSLTTDEQDYYFGKAQAQAIRDGADIAQVVNAGRTKGSMFTADDGKRYTNEGTTKRGYARKVAGRVLRPTPAQIYKDAKGNREAAIAALLKFGYIIGG